MPNTRIPSPARSLSSYRTPRRYIKRKSSSVESPARYNASLRLTSVINMAKKRTSPLSPLPSRLSVLSDSTDIQIPRRKSWWRNIDDNSGHELDSLENAIDVNTAVAMEEFIGTEVLSQERNNTIDLPDSSDSESINSIVLPQRKLFTQKVIQHEKQFVQLISNRESLAKQNKNKFDDDKITIANDTDISENKKLVTKPVFPTKLSDSPNKTFDASPKNASAKVPKNKVRNIFKSNRPRTKRKNMFAKFIITESEDEVTEIQPKIFEFNKISSSTKIKYLSPAPGGTTNDTEMDDWIHLPSSTMNDKQIEEMLSPCTRSRLSKLSEAKETELGTNSNNTTHNTKQSDTSIKSLSVNLSKNKASSFTKNKRFLQTASNNSQKDASRIINSPESNSTPFRNTQTLSTQNHPSVTKKNNSRIISKNNTPQKLQNKSITNIVSPNKTREIIEISNIVINNISMEVEKESVNSLNRKDVQQENKVDKNNFTLQYESDEEQLPNVSDKLSKVNTVSKVMAQSTSQVELGQIESVGAFEFNTNTENLDVFKKLQEPIVNEQSQKLEENVVGNEKRQKEVFNKVKDQNHNNDDEFEIQNKQQNHNGTVHDLVKSAKFQNYYVNEKEVQIDESSKDEVEKDVNCAIIKTSKQVQNRIDNTTVSKYNRNTSTQESNDKTIQQQEEGSDQEETDMIQEEEVEIVQNDDEEEENDQESDVDEIEESDQANEYEDANNSFNNDNQYSDNDQKDGHKTANGIQMGIDRNGQVINKSENCVIHSPEVILHDKTNQMESFFGRRNSPRKTKSIILKSPFIKPNLTIAEDITGFSDAIKNSSSENSAWDSHRTTRKTLRQTFGKDFTPRKSLRTLVMEKSVKRRTNQVESHWETAVTPRAHSTVLQEMSNHDNSDDNCADHPIHEISKTTRQSTLEMFFQKLQEKSEERRARIEKAVRDSLKESARDDYKFKVPKRPGLWNKRCMKPTQVQPKSRKKTLIPLDNLPAEVEEDLKYKPPKRFKPSSASWITPRLYKFLEVKLEPMYDYKARVRAERLVETIYDFTKQIRRCEVAPADSVRMLKHEMARLRIVQTHFDFDNFFHEYMPRETRVQVVPDIVNKIPLPKHGIFSDIIRD